MLWCEKATANGDVDAYQSLAILFVIHLEPDVLLQNLIVYKDCQQAWWFCSTFLIGFRATSHKQGMRCAHGVAGKLLVEVRMTESSVQRLI